MKTEKFSTVDAFVVADFPEAETAVATVRIAPKILVSGAIEMARSLTYRYALLNRKVSGASGGINAKPDDRESAIAAFVAEALPRVEAGTLHVDAAGSLEPGAIAALDAADSRDAVRLSIVEHTRFTDRLTALGAHSAADEALGGVGSLSGRRVVIEGFAETGPTLAAAAVAYGAKVTAVSTAAGSLANVDGFDPAQLVVAFTEHGTDFVNHLGGEVQPANRIFGQPCDVLYVGSKMGVLNHAGAEYVKAAVVVPTAPVPVTTKAMLMMQEKGAIVLPDFLSTCGPAFAEWPTGAADVAAIEQNATSTIRSLTASLLGGSDGVALEACYQAESFLRSWQDELPFGRPFAA